MADKRIIIFTDPHLCHFNWYGVTSEDRLTRMISQLTEYDEKHPYDEVICLGDSSLDFWTGVDGGSFTEHGINNTKNFIINFLSKLGKPFYLLPGNHEQYDNEYWLQFVGRPRQDSFVIGDYLFITCDTYLDPVNQSDGIYTPVDVDFVKQKIAENPKHPVIILSHGFEINNETSQFFELLKNEKRIVGLFQGHDHKTFVENLGEKADNICIYHAGHFSFTGDTLENQMWGFCDVILGEEGVSVKYIEPGNDVIVNSDTVNYPQREFAEFFMPRRDK